MNVHKNQVAIITTEPVKKNFKNENCYLQRSMTLIGDNEINRIATYQVRTDFVNYEKFEKHFENGLEEVTRTELNDKDEEIEVTVQEMTYRTETINRLTTKSVQQEWYKIQLTHDEINYMAQQLNIPADLPFKEREFYLMKVLLLMETQREQPWGISADKWKIRTEEDLQIPLDEESV